MNNHTVGMYGGKFAVLHQGHVFSMIKASTMVDELHVIISYDTEYEKNFLFNNTKIPHIPYNVRMRWWKQITKDLNHVHVHAVEEKQTGSFSDWENGAIGIKKAIDKPIDVVFSSEPEYSKYFDHLYPNAKHIVLDKERNRYPISATKIREEGVMNDNWNMLPEVVKPYFTKKIVVVGTESVGKSTLVKNLANLYNTNYVEEFGRTYYERIGSYETLPEDFPEIAFEHQYHIKKQNEKARKLLFIDTEANVTQNFSIAYEGIKQNILDEVAKLQKFDLWLFLETDVDWVNDGTRVFGSEKIRIENTERLKQLLEIRGVTWASISGGFEERLSQSMKHVDDLLKRG